MPNVVNVDSVWISENILDGALWFDAPDTEYIFQTDFNAEGIAAFVPVSNVIIDLNGFTITFGTSNRDGTVGIYGIATHSRGGHIGSDAINYPRAVEQGNWHQENVTIKNGRIIWGGTTGTWATCVAAIESPNNVVVDNCYLETGGGDGLPIKMDGGKRISNCYIINHSRSTIDRHQQPACVKVGDCEIFNNIMIGGLSAISVFAGRCHIYHNFMRHGMSYTNGYGIICTNTVDVHAYDNIILPSNGQGILLDECTNHTYRNNLIVSRVKQADTYDVPRELSRSNFKSRGKIENVVFEDNKCLAFGGGDFTGVSNLYLSEGAYGSAPMPNPTQIINNELRSILTVPTTDVIRHFAACLTAQLQGSPEEFAATIVANNVMTSNDELFRLSGYDRGCYQKEPWRWNSLNWDDGQASIPWLDSVLSESRFGFIYPESNRYVNSELLDGLKREAFDEIKELIAAVPTDAGKRKTIYAAWWIADSKATLMDTILGEGVNLEAADVYIPIPGTGEGEVDIKVGHDEIVEYSLIKQRGSGEPVFRVNTGDDFPTEPHFTFDEEHGHEGILKGASLVDDDQRGLVIRFVESRDYVKVDPIIDLSNSWTIAAWYKGLGTGMWRTLARGTGDHQIILDVNGQLGSYDNLGQTHFNDSGFNMNVLSVDEWHHVVAVGRDGATIFFVDGDFVGRITFQSTGDVFSVGNFEDQNQRFADFLDDVRIYDRVLSAEEIKALAEIKPDPTPDPVPDSQITIEEVESLINMLSCININTLSDSQKEEWLKLGTDIKMVLTNYLLLI